MDNIVIKQDSKEDSKALKWVSLACSKDRARAVLNGFLVNEDKTAAADGFRLHIINTTDAMKDSLSCRDKIIKPANGPVSATPKMQEFEVVEGTFPDYTQIVPTKPPVFKIALDKKLLADLKTMPGDKAVVLSFTAANQPVLVTCPGSEASAVIMPMTLPEYTNIDAAE